MTIREALPSAAAQSIDRSPTSPGVLRLSVVAKLGCVAVSALFLANCANDQVARKGEKSREIGAFPQSRYGAASQRVVADGQAVPKGGGRQLIGRSYTVAGKRYTPYDKPVGYTQTGTASWYGIAFHGRRTSNGEVYDRHGISAAHPTMPLPAYARVTNTLNQRSMIVRVNDRGPFHAGRVMDLSQAAADALAFRHLGTARVKVEYLGQASLNGSDDKLRLATLRTDGSPASIPGTSSRTMVASSAPAQPVRAARPQVEEAAAPAISENVRAYAEPARVIPVSSTSPVAAVMSTSMPSGTPVRAAPLPPNRPFDLDTIGNAATPVPLRRTVSVPSRPATTVASLFTAPERAPAERFSANHPFSRDLTGQRILPLTRN